MDYLPLKHLHMSCAVASFALFFLRGIGMLRDSPVMRQRWIKVVPHVIDAVLLSSAIALTWMLGQYPFVDGWLTAKLLALLIYIALGFVALKYGRSKRIRALAWLAALLVFGYIVLVARSHSPFPFH